MRDRRQPRQIIESGMTDQRLGLPENLGLGLIGSETALKTSGHYGHKAHEANNGGLVLGEAALALIATADREYTMADMLAQGNYRLLAMMGAPRADIETALRIGRAAEEARQIANNNNAGF